MPPSNTRRLLDEADALAATADGLSARFARELAQVLRDLERRLPALVTKASQGARTAIIHAARANALRRDLRDLLETAGFGDLTDVALGRRLDGLVTHLARLRLFAAVSAFTTRDYTRIQALQTLAKLDLLNVGEQTARTLWRALVQGIYSGRPVPTLLADLSKTLDEELRLIRTWYDTQTALFTRQVEALKFGEASAYLYAGPVDRKLRPFCEAHVGKVYTRAGINRLDNGQKGAMANVFLAGGGWNCRHTWVALSSESELAPLADTGTRVPEEQARLDAIKPTLKPTNAPPAGDTATPSPNDKSESWPYRDDEPRESLRGRSAREGWEQTLSDDEINALKSYTRGGESKPLNDALRTGETLTAEQLAMTNRLDSAIEKAGTFDKPVTVWRGVDFGSAGVPREIDMLDLPAGITRADFIRASVATYAEGRFVPGQVLQLGGFQSSSFWVEAPLDAALSRKSPGIIFEIQATRGAYLHTLSGFDDEAELLMGRGTKYRVVKVLRSVKFVRDNGSESIRTVVQLAQED